MLIGIAAALALSFAALFRFGRLGPLDFWWGMGLTIGLAAVLGLALDRGYAARLSADARTGAARKTAWGLASAALLYAVFASGRLAAFKLFPFAASGIASVYGLKNGASVLRIVLLLGLVIGPGEELVWRGFLQENLGRGLSRGWGFALTALAYALVHAASGNVMLVLAAGVCGVYWGVMYRIFRSPVLNIVSHTAWDLFIFIVRPL
ncbi:MAG TPA: type II CAAX endopeptidase family protein [Burkholderiales bacterium]|nr:type II CAAX endopeptidase family protein [Burkholderiales bacterium]